MRLRQDLKLLRTQRLVATPELRQAIHILQMSALELAVYIEEQALQNPLLEVEDGGDQEGTEPAEPESAASESDSVEPEHVAEWAEYLGDAGDSAYAPSPGTFPTDRQPEVESVPAADATLSEHLLLQLHVGRAAPEVLRAAESIVAAIDEDGYLRVDIDDLGAATGLSPALLRQALRVVQGLDPAGVGARDLKECLMLQLEALGLGSGLAARIICDHLDDLASSRLARIVTATGCDAAAVAAAAELVRGLDPRPGAALDSAVRPRYVVPDVFVERVDGEYVIVLNEGALPRLRISPFYRRMAAEARQQGAPAATAEAAAFLGDRFRGATWLLRCLEQRRSTLYRVTESIMRYQVDFLDSGIRHMRPLTLADVAADVGVHESTVSRAVAGKYAQTPRGAFELKFFFARGLASARGGEVSSTSVRKVMRELIEAEDRRRPHSDQRLVELLAQRGAHLSRRTVTKYRLELGIPSSAQRRR